MAHYAFLDENNVVVEVITGVDEDDTSTLPSEFSSWEEFYADFRGMTCKRTSYNTHNNVHDLGGTPFRGNYAGIGSIYDATNDIFIKNKPYDSWVLDVDNARWKAPIDEPTDTNLDLDTSLPAKRYLWNEDSQAWDLQEEYNYNSSTEEWELVE